MPMLLKVFIFLRWCVAVSGISLFTSGYVYCMEMVYIIPIIVVVLIIIIFISSIIIFSLLTRLEECGAPS